MEEKRILLQCYPYSSQIDSSFWHTLCRLKLEKFRLNETPIDITATTRLELNQTLPSFVKIDYESFVSSEKEVENRSLLKDDDGKSQLEPTQYQPQLFGKLIVFNTIDQFNNSDKRQLIIDSAKSIWDSIVDETRRQEVDANLERFLSRLFMIVYADLKQYCFQYWCAFPALNFPPKCFQMSRTHSLDQHFTTSQLIQLLSLYTQLASGDRRYFVIVLKSENSTLDRPTESESESPALDSRSIVSLQPFSQFWSLENILQFESQSQSSSSYRILFAFTDPSPNCKYPGWPLRNYLAYLYCRFAQLLRTMAPETYDKKTMVENFVRKTLFSPALNILSFRLHLHLLRDFAPVDGAPSTSTIDNCSQQQQSIVQQFIQQSLIFRIVFGTGKVGNSAADSANGAESQQQQQQQDLEVDSCQMETGDGGATGAAAAAGICLDSFLSHVFKPGTLFGQDVTDNCGSVYCSMPPIVGWERNPKKMNKLVPRFVDLKHQLDPKVVASDAVHLNLKLMKWRLVPRMDLELLQNTRCLLLGAGTLGCNIARLLMAWGIGSITFVDSAKVSFSNPVRQTLFKFSDCNPSSAPSSDSDPKQQQQQQPPMNRLKAETAAAALREIYPGINSRGVCLSIPMPGHSVPEFAIANVRKDVQKLEKLISEHDVVFLLTDTRESRWLPTLISASLHKTVINVALGFDTFLVSRHGIRIRSNDPIDCQSSLYPKFVGQSKLFEEIVAEFEKIPEELSTAGTSAAAAAAGDSSNRPFSGSTSDSQLGNVLLGSNLGCYYCNDVVSPGDSTRDRTLDQQCTVARPGLSMVASGVAVELLASLIQHPAGPMAPSLLRTGQTNESLAGTVGSILDGAQQQRLAQFGPSAYQDTLELESILGSVPHQIRGFISRFQNFTFCFPPFAQCCACSFTIIDKYRTEGFDFLLSVFNDSTLLEKISGLDQYQNSGEIGDIVSLEISSDEEDD